MSVKLRHWAGPVHLGHCAGPVQKVWPVAHATYLVPGQIRLQVRSMALQERSVGHVQVIVIWYEIWRVSWKAPCSGQGLTLHPVKHHWPLLCAYPGSAPAAAPATGAGAAPVAELLPVLQTELMRAQC